jgi:hypothetical protein
LLRRKKRLRSRLRKLLLLQRRQNLRSRWKHLQMSWLLSFHKLLKNKKHKKKRKFLKKIQRRFKLLSPSLQKSPSKRNKKNKILLDWRSLMMSL